MLRKLVEKHEKEIAAASNEAGALLKVGFSPAPVATNAAELAAYTSAARTLLNLHEVVTRP
jgi:hypothetical protein